MKQIGEKRSEKEDEGERKAKAEDTSPTTGTQGTRNGERVLWRGGCLIAEDMVEPERPDG